jgi:hypothetical protein
MDPRLKASLLWGLVGGLAFLVLVQGYELTAGERVSLTLKAGIAVGVVVVVTAVSSLLQPHLYGNERS